MSDPHQSSTLNLLQARKIAMKFFRWCGRLVSHGCLGRAWVTGLVVRRMVDHDRRRVILALTEAGHACFDAMSGRMERNYRRLQVQFGEEKLRILLVL